MSDLVSEEVVIRAIKDYLINLLERNIQQVDVHDYNAWIPKGGVYVFTGPEKGAHIFDFAERTVTDSLEM